MNDNTSPTGVPDEQATDAIGEISAPVGGLVGLRARALVGITVAGATMSAILPFCTTVSPPPGTVAS